MIVQLAEPWGYCHIKPPRRRLLHLVAGEVRLVQAFGKTLAILADVETGPDGPRIKLSVASGGTRGSAALLPGQMADFPLLDLMLIPRAIGYPDSRPGSAALVFVQLVTKQQTARSAR